MDPSRDIFEARGINGESGCMVVVRPDQYIADVLPLDAHEELASYFDRLLRRELLVEGDDPTWLQARPMALS